MSNKGVLLVFAKSPEAGKVKTRLIPDIGVDAATDLYKELLIRTLDTSIDSCFSNKQLWISGDSKNVFFKDSNKLSSFNKLKQYGNDLGERMFNAFQQALTEHKYAVLIGSDCPSMTAHDLSVASNMLESEKDVVLGPAADGGYYLIGLKKNNINLFNDIDWGSKTVFEKTISKAEKLNLNIGLLSQRNDIDRVSDIEEYKKMKERESVV